MSKIALVVGVTGITGRSVAESLIRKGWNTYGLSRNPNKDVEGLTPVAADLLDRGNLKSALADLRPTHIFISTWMRKETEAENIKVHDDKKFIRCPVPAKICSARCISYRIKTLFRSI